MRRLYLSILSFLLIFFITSTSGYSQMVDSVSMDAGYANDVYYSFSGGTIQTVDRTNWDIGFYTATFSAGIIINDGNGVELHTYPNADTSGWAAIDTTGLSTWPKLFNSTEVWEDGAFNRAAAGHPDYGWGMYNAINHNVVGDSLYIVKLADGTFKKLWIVHKLSVQNTYQIRYANLDGSDEINETLDISGYTDKNFVYYSFAGQQLIDREPASNSWDILFTKYNTILEGGSPYVVTGVLCNENVKSNRFDMVDPAFSDWSAMSLDSVRNGIGYDWKNFDFTTGWEVYDSTLFFVKDLHGDVYKLVFTGFGGSTSGKVIFEKTMLSPAGISESTGMNNLRVYPNPASEFVVVEELQNTKDSPVVISDLSGKEVYKGVLSGSTKINISQLRPGIYILTAGTGSAKAIQKLLVR